MGLKGLEFLTWRTSEEVIKRQKKNKYTGYINGVITEKRREAYTVRRSKDGVASK